MVEPPLHLGCVALTGAGLLLAGAVGCVVVLGCVATLDGVLGVLGVLAGCSCAAATTEKESLDTASVGLAVGSPQVFKLLSIVPFSPSQPMLRSFAISIT